MASSEPPLTRESLRSARIEVPDHALHRSFGAETVVLNLETSRYHGLNETGGRMLELVAELGSVEAVCARLAPEYDRPPAELERDLVDLCLDLAERGLIVAHPPAGQ